MKESVSETEQKGDEKEGSSDTEARLRQRVRDLELELAQVKLAHVQAQCSNQVLLTAALLRYTKPDGHWHTKLVVTLRENVSGCCALIFHSDLSLLLTNIHTYDANQSS